MRLWQRCFPVNFVKFLRTPFLQNVSRLWHRCFPVNFIKFLRRLFLQNTSGGCFWNCFDLTWFLEYLNNFNIFFLPLKQPHWSLQVYNMYCHVFICCCLITLRKTTLSIFIIPSTNWYFRLFNKQFDNLEWWLFGFVDVFRSNIFYAT